MTRDISSHLLRLAVFTRLTGKNVAKDANAHPHNDKYISKFWMTKEYFLVPELTIPHKNSKIHGRVFAASFDTHKLSHIHSSHEKIQTIRTPPSVAFCAAVAPMMIGIAMIAAKGRTYRKYRVTTEKFSILLYIMPICVTISSSPSLPFFPVFSVLRRPAT